MYLLFVLPFLLYYVFYPGGKKTWLKRKKEIDLHQGEHFLDELHEDELL